MYVYIHSMSMCIHKSVEKFIFMTYRLYEFIVIVFACYWSLTAHSYLQLLTIGIKHRKLHSFYSLSVLFCYFVIHVLLRFKQECEKVRKQGDISNT